MARDKDDLDRHITGNYGEEQFPERRKRKGFDRWNWNDQSETDEEDDR